MSEHTAEHGKKFESTTKFFEIPSLHSGPNDMENQLSTTHLNKCPRQVMGCSTGGPNTTCISCRKKLCCMNL